MIEAPFSDADYSSDYLDEFHGMESIDFSEDYEEEKNPFPTNNGERIGANIDENVVA